MPTTFAVYIGTGRIFDRLTRLASRKIANLPKSSHIELLYGPLPSPTSFCISASKRDGHKVRQKLIKFDPHHWRFWTLPDLDNAKVWTEATRHLGKSYDLLGAVLSVTPFACASDKAVFCSQYMGMLCGFPDPHTLTPSDWERHAIMSGAEMTILTKGAARD